MFLTYFTGQGLTQLYKGELSISAVQKENYAQSGKLHKWKQRNHNSLCASLSTIIQI